MKTYVKVKYYFTRLLKIDECRNSIFSPKTSTQQSVFTDASWSQWHFYSIIIFNRHSIDKRKYVSTWPCILSEVCQLRNVFYSQMSYQFHITFTNEWSSISNFTNYIVMYNKIILSIRLSISDWIVITNGLSISNYINSSKIEIRHMYLFTVFIFFLVRSFLCIVNKGTDFWKRDFMISDLVW